MADRKQLIRKVLDSKNMHGSMAWRDNPHIRPDIKALLNNPDRYERGAREDIAVQEAHFIREADKKNKSLPVLHASWQQQGWFSELSEAEREALGRSKRKSRGQDKNYHIKRVAGQYQVFYREARIRHLWLAQVQEKGDRFWGYTLSKNLRTVWDRVEIGREAWTRVCSLMEPEIPTDLTMGPRRAVREIVRESLLVAITLLKANEIVPEEVVKDPSYTLCLRLLCSEVTKRLQSRKSDVESIINEYAGRVRDIVPDEAMVERVNRDDPEEAVTSLADTDLVDFGF